MIDWVIVAVPMWAVMRRLWWQYASVPFCSSSGRRTRPTMPPATCRTAWCSPWQHLTALCCTTRRCAVPEQDGPVPRTVYSPKHGVHCGHAYYHSRCLQQWLTWHCMVWLLALIMTSDRAGLHGVILWAQVTMACQLDMHHPRVSCAESSWLHQ